MRLRWVCPGAMCLVLLAWAAPPAAAQAFVPARGEGAVTIEYQGSIVRKHLTTVLGPTDSGRIDSQGLLIDFTLGLGKKFAISVGVPYIGARYVGSKPHTLNATEQALAPNFRTLDDGNYHPAWQDLRVEVRYGLQLGGFHVAPFVTGIVPTHSYETLSHAAIGRDIRELQVGAYAARILDPPGLPRAFVQFGVTHGFEQTIAGTPRQRDLLSFEGGFLTSSRLRVFGLASAEITHGGIDVPHSARQDYSGLLYINHDRISREDMVDVGIGAAFELDERLALVGSLAKTVWGINGHAHWGVLTLGMSYGIGKSRPRASSSTSSSAGQGEMPETCHMAASPESRLEKCVCLRK